MRTSTFCTTDITVQSDGSIILSLETHQGDLSVHMDREEFLMFLTDGHNKLIESKDVKRLLREKRELLREMQR